MIITLLKDTIFVIPTSAWYQDKICRVVYLRNPSRISIGEF